MGTNMRKDKTKEVLIEAKNGGVQRTYDNTRVIDRLKDSGHLKMGFTDERWPISSTVYWLTKTGDELLSGMLPPENEIPDEGE